MFFVAKLNFFFAKKSRFRFHLQWKELLEKKVLRNRRQTQEEKENENDRQRERERKRTREKNKKKEDKGKWVKEEKSQNKLDERE